MSTTVAVSTAATVGAYAALTAAIAAGVALTAHFVETYYPGIDASTATIDGSQVVTLQWSKEKTKSAIRDIVLAKTRENLNNPAIYFRVTKYNNCDRPIQVALEPYTKSVMANNMRIWGWSSITGVRTDAQSVISNAFPSSGIIEDFQGVPHFHALSIDGSHMQGLKAMYTVHSFYSSLIAV